VDLSLTEQILCSIKISYATILEFSGKYFLTLEGNTSLLIEGQLFESTSKDDPQSRFEPLRNLVGIKVIEASAGDSGILKVVFAGGASLSCQPDGNYEPWNVAGPHGLIVCMPSGELAVWGPLENHG